MLAGYLAGALATGVAVLLGIVLLGGTAGPVVVLGYALAAAVAARRWAGARLAGAELTAEDRILRTTATGVLVLAVLLAAASALVAALA
ncbi:MAG TPA: hypothetical protein VLA98_04470 [Solirubrobacteraceae bacterium]|nr:hypothetical protein [Solirubrobacteraceae bacterium]